MPDLTMCEGDGCKAKDTCYRYTTTPTPHRQSYFMTPPVDAKGECEYYIKVIPVDSRKASMGK